MNKGKFTALIITIFFLIVGGSIFYLTYFGFDLDPSQKYVKRHLAPKTEPKLKSLKPLYKKDTLDQNSFNNIINIAEECEENKNNNKKCFKEININDFHSKPNDLPASLNALEIEILKKDPILPEHMEQFFLFLESEENLSEEDKNYRFQHFKQKVKRQIQLNKQ